MIKLIIFDLDGVLVESKKIHFETLKDSLPPEFKISWSDHLALFDGLKTNQNLSYL
jgi:beta-phosphoglucomutase-like phosphatase (HAD superfamily)